MRRSRGVDTQRHERERHARQLRLVLQCTGSGSVAGSGSDQCHREERPHGGYKGLSNQYPLSRSGFDKQEFMDNVKNSVNDQYREEQKCRTSSPQWLPAANKEKNHTGEQPLILQNFLAANKQEQVDGVLPAPTPLGKRQSKSAGIYRDDPDFFCRGNSTHQYLTATELPGQSERLVDLTLGRPTRTSLLRVRHRTKSAPGVRPVVEFKSHLHKQQEMAAKTEDRYKSVEVPHELLPVTENHETVHQFLIGARYNRMNHHDAKCLNNLGLFVSRHDPLLCFKMNVPPKEAHQKTNLQGSSSYSDLTESCESFGSSSSLNELTASSVRDQEPLSPKSAWVGGTTNRDDRIVATNGSVRSSTPAPSPSPANRSRETFASSHGGQRNIPKMKLIHGKTLTTDNGRSTGGKDHHCCIMCKSEDPAKHYQRFAAGSHFARVREQGQVEEEEDWDHNVDHMMVQQYHLRIMGVKYGVKSGPQAPPRNNLLYTTKKPINTDLPTIKQQKKTSRNINKNNINDDAAKTTQKDAAALIEEKPPSTTSRISVRISTHTSEVGEEEDEEVYPSPENTPRNDVTQMIKASDVADCNNNKCTQPEEVGNVEPSNNLEEPEVLPDEAKELSPTDEYPEGDLSETGNNAAGQTDVIGNQHDSSVGENEENVGSICDAKHDQQDSNHAARDVPKNQTDEGIGAIMNAEDTESTDPLDHKDEEEPNQEKQVVTDNEDLCQSPIVDNPVTLSNDNLVR